MNASEKPTIYTIGHSTHAIAEFLAMLESFGVQMVVDIRRYPGSRRFPAFNQPSLATTLEGHGITYRHCEALGGRRPVRPGSQNDRWRNTSFRGYADYMETEAFEAALEALEALAREQPTAYMCAEAVWWRCHRSMVSDALKARGWRVLHIMPSGKAEEHPYTSPASIDHNRLSYSGGEPARSGRH